MSATAMPPPSAMSDNDRARFRFLILAIASKKKMSVSELAAWRMEASAPTRKMGISKDTARNVRTIEGLAIIHAA